MALQDDLLALERQFWTGNADFYRRNLDDECLMAFPEMSGRFSREDVAKTIGDSGPRWHGVRISPRAFIQPAEDVALLTYEASAARGDDERYHALVSSAYVRRERSWRLAFHQQTRLPGP